MTRVLAALMAVLLLSAAVTAHADEDGKPEIKVSADLELFHESSKDVATDEDNDKFKSNQLYVNFDGKFSDGLAAKLKTDFADVVSSDGKLVTEKIVEEANFTWKEIGGSPLTVVFGKDEMPFGTDYDKTLNDPIVHHFEVDKVWGLNAALPLPGFGKLEAGTYQHRHGGDADQELLDSASGRVKFDKLVDNLVAQVSVASESYSDETDDETGEVTMKDSELRYSVGGIYKVPDLGLVHAEYVGFNNRKGKMDYDPGVVSVGATITSVEQFSFFARVEVILSDDEPAEGNEETFWTVGVEYRPAEKYQLFAEFSNFNSGDMKDASDLAVAEDSIENALLLGARAKF